MTKPDKWIIVKINDTYKVFATWAGGYLDGDYWQLNSGIEEVEQEGEFYCFIGYSGSRYFCRKRSYGIATAHGQAVLDNLKERLLLNDHVLEVLDDREDWTTLIQ